MPLNRPRVEDVQLPAALVVRQNQLTAEQARWAEENDLRVFDAPVADGLLRIIVSQAPYCLISIGKRASFQFTGPWRFATIDEQAEALRFVKMRFPHLPELRRRPDAAAVTRSPMLSWVAAR
jgi:hypothetical protein